MRNQLIKSIFLVACLAFVSVPLPVNAQSSNVGLSIGTVSSSATRGSGVPVFALVTNKGAKTLRTTVSISVVSPCGGETSLGSTKVSLEPDRAVSLSAVYQIPADACTGMYAVTISADSPGGKGAAKASTTSPSATAYFEVK